MPAAGVKLAQGGDGAARDRKSVISDHWTAADRCPSFSGAGKE
jgi:hypothetical protein